MSFFLTYLFIALIGLCLTIIIVFNKYRNEQRKFYSVIFLQLFLAILIGLALFSNYEKKKYSFKGIISHIKYGTKQIPTITIGHERYHLSPMRDFTKIVSVGDSAIKNKDEMQVKFISKSTKAIIYMEL